MDAWSLKFNPYGKPSFSVDLLEENQSSEEEYITGFIQSNDCIFSDLSYELELEAATSSTVQVVCVYINDAYEPSIYENGKIRFTDQNGRNRRIFSDCFGFVKLDLTLLMDDETNQNLETEYIPVLVKREGLNESIKSMAEYVYNHQELLLLNGESLPRDLAGLKRSKYRNLMSQIILAEQLAIIYENSFGYFKANSRFRIEKEPTIDYLEHLQYITSSTVEYAVTHPEQLRRVNSGVGVHIGNRVYQPQKTKFDKNVVSYDIEENRIIIGFLRLMIYSVKTLQKQCEDLLEKIPQNEDYSSEYVFSSFFMFAETRKVLEDGLSKLNKLSTKFVQLYDLYSNALGIDEEPLKIQPRPTAIFMTVPQYNKIFESIYQWFNAGIYDFENEKYMLSFIKISTLYEQYLLEKLYEYIIDCGYNLCKVSGFTYPMTSNAKYKNVSGNNTFLFSNGEKYITLYYQPVIYNSSRSLLNGIGLYRNNSIHVDNENYDSRTRGRYYTPDFLIKIEEQGIDKYIILDAKFSSIDTVKNYEIKNLAFKYLFSISPINSEDSIIGMCLIYGKCKEAEMLASVYDNQMPNYDIVPFAELLPFMEGIANERQFTNLDKLFEKIL